MSNNEIFDHQKAVSAMASGSNEEVLRGLEARGVQSRITEAQLTALEDAEIFRLASVPFRIREHVVLQRRPIADAFDWRQILKNANDAINWRKTQTLVATGMIGILSCAAVTGIINHQTKSITPEQPLTAPPAEPTPRIFQTRTPDGKATLDLTPFLNQTNPNTDLNIRP